MKQMKKRSLLTSTLLIVLVISMISACAKTNETPAASIQPQESAAATDKPAVKAEDPLGKYEPAIELNIARTNDNLKFDEGTSIDKNPYYDAYSRDLGVNVKNAWVVSGADAYNSKLNVAISSGDIPDLVSVQSLQFKNLVEADMVEDLTEAYEKYASEDLKKLMTDDGGFAMKASTIDGKLYAIPYTIPAIGTTKMLWLREDWLNKVNLPAPKTMDDVMNIAKAFANDDPDNNGQKDTYGFGVSKELFFWGAPGLEGFFQGYGAYPASWYTDSSGSIVYGSTQPQVKEALLKLAEMYKAGLIDKEFGVKDTAKVFESISAGKVGMFYGDFAVPWYANKDSIVQNPEAKWVAYPIPSATDSPAKTFIGSSVASFYAIKKGYAHPEVVVKLANYWVDRTIVNVDESLGSNKETGTQIYPYAIVTPSQAMEAVETYGTLKAAFAGGDTYDTSKFTSNEKFYYDNITAYNADRLNTKDTKILNGWIADRTYGEKGGVEVVDYYLKNNLYINTALTVSSTPTMAEKMATLNKMENVMMTRIIVGDVGIDEFDRFVQDWYKQGGEQITKEVNELK
ncbi:extracellular solute-binding protein [Paenibacillus eucommiae]|uniref:Aldouronate transport system substrate-binding protein n=1 Tax=Paenibacillus eucommiae TaxID=1355755 RepID=A0ABS4J6X1_9BACL|nr:extracellular solute-binding protein [Paenibacillus eucommiae]MBP1994529.1 putative aldouronate transport system substrate-binding protein [Paenibacillus eucommiae]